jgi:hypothetical protein
MQHSVPQFIDVEDRIVGPFTAKQFMWLGIAGGLLFILWSYCDVSLFVTMAVPILLFFGALAFYKPNGRPFIIFLQSIFFFFTSSRAYVWKRVFKKDKIKIKRGIKKLSASGGIETRIFDKSRLRELAWKIETQSVKTKN